MPPPHALTDIDRTVAGAGSADAALLALAAAQHGLVTTAQMSYLGLSRDATFHRVRRGRLHPVHRGVFAVEGPPWRLPAPFAAAILACGPGSAISHVSAAFLWELLRFEGGPIHVVSRIRRRSRRGIEVHRTRSLARREVRLIDGIPVTSPVRTLIDIAGVCSAREVERAVNEGRLRRLVTEHELDRTVAEARGRSGAAALAVLLARETGSDFSRSEAEDLLLRIIRDAGLPLPRRNVFIHGFELDFFWPALSLNIEVDGVRWHATGDRLVRDRARDASLAAHGIQVIRVTWRQLQDEARLIAQLAAAIALAESRATTRNLGVGV